MSAEKNNSAKSIFIISPIGKFWAHNRYMESNDSPLKKAC